MRLQRQGGFSLIEMMIAMPILAFGILGVMASFKWSDHGLRQGAVGMRALALAEARLEAKRALPWTALLRDDVNGDGEFEITMRDDGQPPDLRADDGLYTAASEQNGIEVRWTVRPDRPGPLQAAGSVAITASARYTISQGQWREVTVATLRANPGYMGAR